MIKAMRRKRRDLYHRGGPGPNPQMTGDLTALVGDCTGLTGCCSLVYGDCSGVIGNCTGVMGDLTDIAGDLDKCRLTEQDRNSGLGVLVMDLVQEGA